MRINRSIQLWPKQGTVHQYWRCHNKEAYLASGEMKDLYFKCLELALKHDKIGEKVKIRAYCAMNNHFHQINSYEDGSHHLSRFMRQAHSHFGGNFNRIHKRCGKVAQGRPKTPLIQNESHEIRVHFYVEANPIRANICKLEQLKDYIFSSYGFYAYGKKTKYTYLLDPPAWYLKLGKTPQERQKRYRKLFKAYLNEYRPEYSRTLKQRYIGNPDWINKTTLKIKEKLKKRSEALKHSKQNHRDSLDST